MYGINYQRNVYMLVVLRPYEDEIPAHLYRLHNRSHMYRINNDDSVCLQTFYSQIFTNVIVSQS